MDGSAYADGVVDVASSTVWQRDAFGNLLAQWHCSYLDVEASVDDYLSSEPDWYTTYVYDCYQPD